MHSVFILIKNNFLRSINGLSGKKQVQNSLAIGLIGLNFFLLFGFFLFQNFTTFLSFPELADYWLFSGYLTGISVALLFSITKVVANNQTSDADFLLSMPISKLTIVISKNLYKYLMDLLIVTITVLPCLLMYMLLIEFSASFLLIGLLSIFLIAAFSLGISNILEALLSRLFGQFGLAGVFRSIFLLIAMGLAMFIILYPQLQTQSLTINDIDKIIGSFIPAQWFVIILSRNEMFYLLFVFIFFLTPCFTGICFQAFNYGKSFDSVRKTKKKIKYKNDQSVFKGLLLKETKKFFNTPIYFINSIIGCLFAIGAIIFIFVGASFLESLLPNLTSDDKIALLAIGMGFSVAMTTISSVTISMEKDHLWILKSAPISFWQIYFSKTTLQIILTAPIVFFGILISGLIMQSNVGIVIALALIGSIYSVMISFLGLLINLKFPKLNWENEAQVVKQSLSVFLSLFANLFLIIIPIIIFLISTNLVITLIITAIVYILVLVIVLLISKIYGKKMFDAL